MADFSHHGVDEFGFPLTAAQRLQRMQGIGPSQGEYGTSPADERRDPVAPFDYDAFMEQQRAALAPFRLIRGQKVV